jgi:hypothetical protein
MVYSVASLPLLFIKKKCFHDNTIPNVDIFNRQYIFSRIDLIQEYFEDGTGCPIISTEILNIIKTRQIFPGQQLRLLVRLSSTLHHIEYVSRQTGAESEIDEMMAHLDEAKRVHEEQQNEKTCDNCATIDTATKLNATDDRQGRDLHYCAQCERLLSTKEYNKWKDVRT